MSRNASDEVSWDPGRKLGQKQGLGKKNTATKQGPEAGWWWGGKVLSPPLRGKPDRPERVTNESEMEKRT